MPDLSISKVIPPTLPIKYPPPTIRAKLFKEQFSVADQLKSQIEFKNSEMYELKKMVGCPLNLFKATLIRTCTLITEIKT